MRRGKRDGNHTAIVRALRAVGRSVVELHGVGGGVPDLLVAWPGGVVLIEIKAPRTGRLLDSQRDFARSWRGPRGSLVVARTVEDALAACGVLPSPRDHDATPGPTTPPR
jgi:hypothetical protein